MSIAIRMTASAQSTDTTASPRLLFSVARDKLARMKATAVRGTICGCPGTILCRTGRVTVQPSNTRVGTKTPEPLTTLERSTKSTDCLPEVFAPSVLFCGSLTFLEGESHAKLDLTTGCGSFRDRSKLWRIDEAI